MSDFTLFLILFPVIFGLLMWLKHGSDRKYGTQAQRAAEMNGYAPAAPEHTERPVRYESTPIRVITPERPVIVAPAPPVNTGQPVRLSGNDTWHKLQTAIHLMIVGPTNAGKSTMARAVLWGRVEQGDQVLILDPHAAPDEWSGVPAVGTGRDYPAIEQAMLALLTEMTDRYQQRAERPGYVAQALTIFIDEWPSIQTHCKATAATFMAALAQEGRKVAMRLVILTQSNRVESLGIAGKGDIRDNFTTLLLAEKALELCPASGSLDRPAAVNQGGGYVAAYAGFAPSVADRKMSYIVLWQPTASDPAAGADDTIPEGMDPDLYRRFVNKEDLLEPLRTSSEIGEDYRSEREPVTARTSSQQLEKAVFSASYQDKTMVRTEQIAAQADVPDDDLSIAIRALINAGLSRNKVITLLTIPGGRAEQLKRVKVALGESETGAV
ncbi:MAG: ATP-binding protein [Herpetosiphonaceae bacterium]|nr:ATP-binding protein [Herpetosiphonaceae bacterium]